jgi:Domain of unknown function (DUF4169)
MAEIVNLRRAKKQKARAAKERDAEVSRVRFGTSKSQEKVNSARSDKERSDLEGKKLDPDKPLDR